MRFPKFILQAFVLVTLAMALAPMSAHAVENFGEDRTGVISDEVASAFLQEALRRLELATCENDQPCAPATQAEIQNPPITLKDTRAALVTSMQSAVVSWCGLDHRRSLFPLLAHRRDVKRYGARQINLMALVHSDLMQRQMQGYQESGEECPADMKVDLDSQLPKL
jgi:hypothetical protein